MYKNEIEIDFFRCVRALFKRWMFIALITILFFVAGYAYTFDPGKDKYTSKATVYAASDISYTESTSAVTAMNAYLDVAKSYKVGQRAALILGRSDIGARDIMDAVKVTSSSRASSSTVTANFLNASATIITFSATTSDPQLSMAIADAMAESYTIEMASILKTDSVKMLDNAYTYSIEYNATKEAWKKRLLFALVGFMIAFFVVVICEIVDTKVRTVREATIRNRIPVIGMIPEYKD